MIVLFFILCTTPLPDNVQSTVVQDLGDHSFEAEGVKLIAFHTALVTDGSCISVLIVIYLLVRQVARG